MKIRLYQEHKKIGRINFPMSNFLSENIMEREFYKIFSGKELPLLKWELNVIFFCSVDDPGRTPDRSEPLFKIHTNNCCTQISLVHCWNSWQGLCECHQNKIIWIWRRKILHHPLTNDLILVPEIDLVCQSPARCVAS